MSNAKDFIKRKLSVDVEDALDRMDTETLNRFATIMRRPNLQVRMSRDRAPYGVVIGTPYGSVLLDDSLTSIDMVYVNGARFSVKENGIDAIEKLVDNVESAKEVLGSIQGRQKSGRKTRARRRSQDEVSIEDIQVAAAADLQAAGIQYENIFSELNGLLLDSNVSASDIVDELFSFNVDEKDIPYFLTHESQYRMDILSRVYNVPLGTAQMNYEFEPITADDSFLGRLMTSIGVEEAEYDAKNGVLRVGERLITNLPSVDEKGVFSNGNKRYLPYHIGYFAEGEGSRVERLRVIDPVQTALDSVKLQYDMSSGDIKFQTILDVTRNLIDFDKHPYGEEILDTLKRKIVLDKSYASTNSLLNEFYDKTDDLGAVNTMMLDEDARGLIDPLGTSNGSNMGMIFYLTKDAQINPDGTLIRGESEHSLVGDILNEHFVDKDNFNRNQMSFNAMLTSTDVKKLKVAYAEFGLFNSEDAVVMTQKGAEQYGYSDENGETHGVKRVGDKMEDLGHGNKSVISLIVDPEMDLETAREQQLENAVKFAQLNPDVDMVVSPISLASRMNMGVAHEGLAGQTSDLHLPDGTVVKDGVTEIMYMSLPQTAEHKSKDYAVEGQGRRYSTLFRYALASKIGMDMYNQAFVNDEVRAEHIDKAATAFQRMGISFVDDTQLVTPGNVKQVVDAPTIDVSEYAGFTPSVIRLSLMKQMENGQINIDLGENQLVSPLTGEVMKDSDGRNILPIRVTEGGIIPYRYSEIFKDLSLGNTKNLQRHYDHAVGNDYSLLTRKNNILKNIDTMTFTEGAHTDIIVPDPRLGLDEVRSTLDTARVIAHRDPAIKSGNTIFFKNVGGGEANVMHMQPLIAPQQDKDYDGDSEGASKEEQLNLTQAGRDEMYNRSSVTEQLNHYGEVYLALGGHFKAAATANNIDTSDLTFDDGKSNEELQALVERDLKQIVNSPQSYGAYALSFTDKQSLLDSLGKLADDGIKGNRADLEHHFENGYTVDENRAVMKALIAKSEWTGLAGSVTNDLIANLGDQEFDAELVRTAMDITHTMTQSVLQMKKNADKLPVIDQGIKDMKSVMSGKYDIERSRQVLKEVTNGLIPEQAVDKFVNLVAAKQEPEAKFGHGVLNGTDMSTAKLSYKSGKQFGKALKDITNEQIGLDDDLASLLNQF
jgi:RNA polymerase rpb2, domain 6